MAKSDILNSITVFEYFHRDIKILAFGSFGELKLFLLGCGGLWKAEMSMIGENLVKDEFGPPAENGTGEGDQDDTGDDAICSLRPCSSKWLCEVWGPINYYL